MQLLKYQETQLTEINTKISELKKTLLTHKQNLKLKDQEKKDAEQQEIDTINKLDGLKKKERKLADDIRSYNDNLIYLKQSHEFKREELIKLNNEANKLKEEKNAFESTKNSIFGNIQDLVRKSTSLVDIIMSSKTKLELVSMSFEELKKKKNENETEKHQFECEINRVIEEIDVSKMFSEKKMDLHKKEQHLRIKLIELDGMQNTIHVHAHKAMT